jgi:preprotein translocase subunit SecG
MAVAFAGTLVSSGVHDALLMMIVIGGIIFCTGTLGLYLFWRDKEDKDGY